MSNDLTANLRASEIVTEELEWHQRVMRAIQSGTLAEAGLQLAQIVNFALKTQHDEQFALEVKNCVTTFWDRCIRELRQG